MLVKPTKHKRRKKREQCLERRRTGRELLREQELVRQRMEAVKKLGPEFVFD